MARHALILAAALAACGPTTVGTVSFDISPAEPRTGDDIKIVATVVQFVETFEIRASQGGQELVFGRQDMTEEPHFGVGRKFTLTLPAEQTAKGQTWTLSAVGADGRKQQTGTASVAIGNTAPTATVTVGPADPRRMDVLVASGVGEDVDGDPVTLTYRWRVNNRDTDITGPEFPAMTARRNDVVSVVAIPSDGEAEGPEATASVTVRNSPPTASVVLTPDSPNTTTPLLAVASGTDPDDDDLTFSYSWEVNGVQLSTTTAELAAHLHKRDDVVRVIAVARDGRTLSGPASDETVIENSPPTTPVVQIPTKDGTVSSYADIFCRMLTPSTDADRDPLTYTYTWWLNGIEYTGPTETKDFPGDVIPYDVTEDGDEWWCSVTASDGAVTSAAAVSDKVAIVPTLTYRIGSSGLVNMGTDCGSGGHRYGSGGTFGVFWTDAGSVRPRTITIDYQMGVNCTGTAARSAFINSTSVGTAPSGSTTQCTCSPTTYKQSVTYAVPTSYVPGGRNEFTMTRSSSDGWSSNSEWRDGSTEVWAVVTVTY